MKRAVFTGLAVLVAWCGVGLNLASAQFGTLGQPPIRPRPTVSPFVNLGDGGGALSYYGLVRPEMDATKALQQLQQNQGLLNPDGTLKSPLAQSQDQNTGLTTGHAATFFNYSHYYPQNPYNGTIGVPAVIGVGSGLGGYGLGAGTGIGTGFGVGAIGVGGVGVGGRAFFGPNLGAGFR